MAMTEYQRKLVEENLDLVGQVIHSKMGITNGPMTSYEDLYQVGCEAICKAALQYSPQKGIFPPFARKVIYHSLIDYCRRVNYRSQNQTDIFFDCDNSAMAMLLISTESEAAMSDVDHSDAVRIFKKRKEEFSGIAKAGMEAMELQMAGYTTSEIADMYGTTRNNITAWISRARKRLVADQDLMAALR